MIRLEVFPDGAVFDHGEIDAAGSLELDALLELSIQTTTVD